MKEKNTGQRGKVPEGSFFPYGTVALLVACAAGTLAFDASGGSELFICFPREPFQIYGAPALLSLFTHEGFGHLLANGVILSLVAPRLEWRVGPEKLLLFFSSAASAASPAKQR